MPQIHPTAIVHDGAKLADSVEVGPYSIVGPDVVLGEGVRLISHVNVEGHTEIGEGCSIYPFASLGAPPQHLGHKGEPTQLIIGARNVIREHVTMNTGTVAGGGVTRVGSDSLFMTASRSLYAVHTEAIGAHWC